MQAGNVFLVLVFMETKDKKIECWEISQGQRVTYQKAKTLFKYNEKESALEYTHPTYPQQLCKVG